MRRRVVTALGVGLLFYALGDVLLWQRIFEAHALYALDDTYQTGHRAVLLGLIGVGMALLYDTRLWALWYGLAFYTLAFGGLEDVLYYWLGGRQIPEVLPWLNDNHLILFKPVTAAALLASTTVWLAFWIGSLFSSTAVRLAVNRVRPARRHVTV